MKRILVLAILTGLVLSASASALSLSQPSQIGPDIEKSYNMEVGFLERKITVTGNKNSSKINAANTVPRFLSPALDYSDQPDNENHKILTKEVEWTDRLDEGEQKTYTVIFAYWRVLMVLFIAGIAGYGVRKHRHHQLLSKSKREGDDTGRVDINIYNTGEEMVDLTVEEFIPSSLDIDKIVTGDPDVEETENGQKIIWSIKSLEKGDQRVLSYKIRSKENITAVFSVPATVMRTDDKKITESNDLEVQLDPSNRDST